MLGKTEGRGILPGSAKTQSLLVQKRTSLTTMTVVSLSKDLLMHPSFEAGYWVCCVDEQWRVVVPDSTTLEILIKSSVLFKVSGSHKQVSL